MVTNLDYTLRGKVAFVTGGGRGLGLEISRHLAASGADIFITGRTSASLESARDAIAETGARSACAVADVTDFAAMQRAIQKCEAQLGPVDILVNNAGTGIGGPLAAADIDAWWHVVEVNLKGPLIACRLILPSMIERGRGHVVNVGSYQGTAPTPGVSAYGTSKAALLRLTDSVAAEVIDKGVIVMAVSPGFVRTDMGREAETQLKASVPGFTGFDKEYVFEPDAIARLVCRIAKGDADVFSGRLLHVKDDLDAMLADSDAIIAENRLALSFKARD